VDCSRTNEKKLRCGVNRFVPADFSVTKWQTNCALGSVHSSFIPIDMIGSLASARIGSRPPPLFIKQGPSFSAPLADNFICLIVLLYQRRVGCIYRIVETRALLVISFAFLSFSSSSSYRLGLHSSSSAICTSPTYATISLTHSLSHSLMN
jgi:hypothetical protein